MRELLFNEERHHTCDCKKRLNEMREKVSDETEEKAHKFIKEHKKFRGLH